jgi:hypothetical protein
MHEVNTPLWLKLLQLTGIVLLLLGVVARAGAGEFWGTLLAAMGFLLFLVGRVIAWIKVG